MICILHGYLLEGSGSNLWTRSVIQSLCRNGETVHLVCLENHPERYDFISRMYQYHQGQRPSLVYQHESPYQGECVLHKPDIGETLPVYVWDQYEEFSNVVPMVELPDSKIEEYISRNVEVAMDVVITHSIEVLHANHAVLMSVVARRVSRKTSIPFAIMPHGSAIEYAVKKDERFHRLATDAFGEAGKIFVIGPEIRQRVGEVFGSLPNLDSKMLDLNLGVDTSLFEPVSPRQRIEKISEMNKLLEDLPRGKTEQQTGQLWNVLSDSMSLTDMKQAIGKSANYISKNPDENVEQKLASIRWEEDKLLLFVGRLIASKGIQLVIAALPLISEKQPGSKLIVVGHGPLREAMEALLWALRNGKEHLVENIVRWGKELEGSQPGPFKGVQSFYSFLHERGEWNGYLAKAQQHLRKDSVIFTGYLTHRELGYLFPCCDVAIFPSVVAEAGPLVFLEALACGCFPLGTYFAGMAASIDSAAAVLPPGVVDVMKLSPDEKETVNDIVKKTPVALGSSKEYKNVLHNLAVQQYDWKSVARKFKTELLELVANRVS